MPSRVSALILGACTLASLSPSLQAQGLPTNLTVTSGSSPVAQANQTITTNGTVTVGPGTSVTFQAGNTITLQNGFHATAGSNFHAFLATSDFVINVTPSSGSTTLAGGSVTYSVTVSSIFNFTGAVYFSAAGVTGLPQGATASFSASSITPPVNSTSSPITLTITTASGITGNYAFTVVGTSLGYSNHLGTSSLTIQDFYLTLSPSTVTISVTGTATYQLSATGLNGFNGTISPTLHWTGTNPCTNLSGFPNQIQPGTSPVTFSLQGLGCASPGTYEFQIYGAWGGFDRIVNGWIVISPYNGTSPLVSCSSSPNPGTAGQAATFSAAPSSGTPPYSYFWSGTVSGSGQSASFVPTTAGTYVAYITVTDSTGRIAASSCSVNVQQGGTALTILTSSTLPYGTAGTAYSQTLAASGGTGSYTWSALSTLPTGLTLSTSGVLSGNPTTAGSYTFYINVADTGGHSVSSQFALTIASGGAQSSIQISLAYPQLSGTYPGGTHQFTFHFTDPLGPSDISGGQIAFNIDTMSPELPVCQLDWYVNGVQNIDINGVVYGSFGSGTLSSMYCTVYTSQSSLTQTAQGYDVSVVLSFPQPLPNTLLPAWTRGIPINSGTGDFTPVGAHTVAHIADDPGDGGSGDDPPDDPVEPLLPGGQPPPGQPPCVGNPIFGSQLSRYSDGTLAAALTASADVESNPGWVNWTENGHLLSPSGEIANTGLAFAQSEDADIAILPFNSGPGNPGGTYQVVGDYYFEHPNPSCAVILNYGFPGFFENRSGKASILGYTRTFNLDGDQVDPTPVIYSVDLNPPLVSGGTSTATIKGMNFGLATGMLGLCYSGDDPCDGSDGADVSVSGITSWTTSSITVTLSAAISATGAYDVQVTSVGAGSGFQSSPTNTAQSNHGTFQVQAQTPAPCGDQRDTITQEYITHGVQLLPQCSWYTQTAHSAYYTFPQFNVNGSYAWALVKLPLTISQSSGYGLDTWTQLIGPPQTINSAYRSPAHNAQIGGAKNSRHMFGDAVDLNNATHTLSEYKQKACAASVAYTNKNGEVTCPSQPDAGANYVEPTTGPCKFNCVHADWRYKNINTYSQ